MNRARVILLLVGGTGISTLAGAAIQKSADAGRMATATAEIEQDNKAVDYYKDEQRNFVLAGKGGFALCYFDDDGVGISHHVKHTYKSSEITADPTAQLRHKLDINGNNCFYYLNRPMN